MELIDFLNMLKISVPLIQTDENKTYLQFIDNYFDKLYIELANEVDQMQLCKLANSFGWINQDMLIHNFRYITNNILKTIKLYYEGKSAAAYSHLKNKVLKIRFDDTDFVYNEYFRIDYLSRDKNFFRIRKKENLISMTANELFHVPFELRTKISTQRFSIPGHPCLYLANTVECCWLEMNQPNNFFVSNFQSKVTLSLIDFCMPHEFQKLETRDEWQSAFKFLMTFPLRVASLVKVKYPEDPFKPEYIIPQLLLQYVKCEKKFDGIIYTSTKNFDRRYNHTLNYSNVIIPVISNKEKGYCNKLRNKFEISHPIEVNESIIHNSLRNTLYAIQEEFVALNK